MPVSMIRRGLARAMSFRKALSSKGLMVVVEAVLDDMRVVTVISDNNGEDA